MKIRWKRVIVILAIAFIVFSLVVPLIDMSIELKNDKIAELDKKININLHEYTRYQLWIIRYIEFKSTYNLLLTLNQIEGIEIPLSVIQMYSNEKDTTLLLVVKKIAKLTGIEDEEIKQLEYLNKEELIEKMAEYEYEYVEILNAFLSEKAQLKKEISVLKTLKYIAIGVASTLQVVGIVIGTQRKNTKKQKQKIN